jgi:hypothetical protein
MMESSFVGNSKQILTVSYSADGISCHSLASRIHGFKIATNVYGKGEGKFYVPLCKNTKESRESAERFIRQRTPVIC